MATATAPSPPAEERNSKRHKGSPEDHQQQQPGDDPRRSPYAGMPPQQQRYYGGPPPPPPHAAGYWRHQQPGYPRSAWGQHPPPPPGQYPPARSPDRYYRDGSRKNPGKQDEEEPTPPYWAGAYRGGSSYWPPQQQQQQQQMPMYPGWPSKSPARRRPDMPPAYRPEDMGYLSTRTIQQSPMMDDDGASSSAGGSAKEKGRGSYKCGRCGVPKKGHVCPYQPKVKRRADEPAPETRNAAVQVERDEFMTLRRLNIRIQGFPESYVTEPYMGESMVVGEVMETTTPASPEPLEGGGAQATTPLETDQRVERI